MRYYTASVQANNDAEQPGFLKLNIPDYTGSDEAYHRWVAPRMPIGSGGGFWWIPAVGSIVIVEEDGGDLFWSLASSGSVNTIPEPFKANYPARVGISSQDGSHYLALETGGNVELVSAVDLSLRSAQSEVLITDSKTRLVSGGKVYLGSSSVDLVSIVHSLLGALQSALTATAIGPQPLDPATQVQLATLKSQLATIKE